MKNEFIILETSEKHILLGLNIANSFHHSSKNRWNIPNNHFRQKKNFSKNNNQMISHFRFLSFFILASRDIKKFGMSQQKSHHSSTWLLKMSQSNEAKNCDREKNQFYDNRNISNLFQFSAQFFQLGTSHSDTNCVQLVLK